jgi:ubiquitin conjugation factor E4 B
MLKVKNPEKYGFKPRVMLKEFIQTFISLADMPEFVHACARDSRSFNRGSFEHAIRILSHDLNESETASILAFLSAVEKRVVEDEVDDEIYGDVPDEFLDPLMATVMLDPVRLPSGVVVDRVTIVQHLLGERNDPFNRAPLTIDMVVGDEELKGRIEEWKRAKREEGRGDKMDTSE